MAPGIVNLPEGYTARPHVFEDAEIVDRAIRVALTSDRGYEAEYRVASSEEERHHGDGRDACGQQPSAISGFQ